MNFTEFKENMRGKRVDVLGVGVSNLPLIRLLAAAGAAVTARDKNQLDRPVADELSALGAALITGTEYLEDLGGEVIFRTPGLYLYRLELVAAAGRGCVITSEMECFLKLCPCRVIGVTGSDGKTTTTTVIAEVLRAAGRTVHMGGNIGTPLLDRVPDMKPDDIAVVELSSFQLMGLDVSPDVGVITNLAPNHLDVHRDMGEYVDAKRNIFRWRTDNLTVLNADNAVTRGMISEVGGRLALFGWRRPEGEACRKVYVKDGVITAEDGRGAYPVVAVDEIAIPGRHNVENVMCAAAAVLDDAPPEAVAGVARHFAGVEHRIEYVRTFRGADYYNDSIASSPSRAIAGLHSFDRKVILIAGGYDKKIPFDTFGEEILSHTKAVCLTGATSQKIYESMLAAGYDGKRPALFRCRDLAEAVTRACEAAAEGDVVLFSPACASFDSYRNFAERGARFKELVNGLV